MPSFSIIAQGGEKLKNKKIYERGNSKKKYIDIYNKRCVGRRKEPDLLPTLNGFPLGCVDRGRDQIIKLK